MCEIAFLQPADISKNEKKEGCCFIHIDFVHVTQKTNLKFIIGGERNEKNL